MGLSAEHEEWLTALYESWGLEKVRRELDRFERNQFAHPEVTAFARAWVEHREAAIRRRKLSVAATAFAACLGAGAAAGLLLTL